MVRRYFMGFLWYAVAALMLVSCVKEENEMPSQLSDMIGYSVSVGESSEQNGTKSGNTNPEDRSVYIERVNGQIGGKQIFLHTVVEDIEEGELQSPSTKGIEIKDAGSVTYDADVHGLLEKIWVSAWVYDSEENYKLGKHYFSNEEVADPWNTNRFWPKNNGFLRFYAYAPDDVKSGISWTNGVPSFTFTVPSDVEQQPDLLVASRDVVNADFGNTVPMNFGHALTAVQFMVDGIHQFQIKTIKVTGVKNSETYSYNTPTGIGISAKSTDGGKWSDNDDSNDGEYILNFVTTEAPYGFVCDGQKDYILNTGNKVMFLMPQGLPDDAKIILEGYDKYTKKEVTVSANIGGNDKTWEKGKRVIYKISFTDVDVQYVLEAVDNTTALDNTRSNTVPFYGEISRSYTVRSYKILHTMGAEYPIYKPVDWRVAEQSSYWDEYGYETGKIINKPVIGQTSFCIENISNVSGDCFHSSESTVLESAVEWDSGTYDVTAIEHNATTKSGDASSHIWLAGRGEVDGVRSGDAIRPDLGKPGYAYDLAAPFTIGRLQEIKDLYNSADKTSYNSVEWTSDDTPADPQNTANSYIVFAPGYYKIPLVYGNAYKDGSMNSSAYSTIAQDATATAMRYDVDNTTQLGNRSVGVKVLGNFLDYNGSNISGAWISGASSAELLWQDEPCLVTEVKLNSSKNYLLFRVRRDCICEGNAVLVIKDQSGKIMWSWHIWVTEGRNVYDNGGGVPQFNPEDPYYSVEAGKPAPNQLRVMENRVVTGVDYVDDKQKLTFTQKQFHVMTAHIGQCDGETKTYSPRNIQIVFEQVDNGDVVNTATLSVKQGEENGTVVATSDNSVYYQYGRKDPMIPGLADGDDKTYYLKDRKPVQQLSVLTSITGEGEVGIYTSSTTTISDAIQNPGVFFINPETRSGYTETLLFNTWLGDWNQTNYFNLWNSNSNVLPMFAYMASTDPKAFFDNFQSVMSLGVTKTVYDPCPPGYEMPRVDAFTGFTFDGLKRRNEGSNKGKYGINVEEGTFTNFSNYNAYSFYVSPMPHEDWSGNEYADADKPGTVLVQALGHRAANGQIAQYGNFGAALTSTPICVQWLVDGESANNSHLKFILQLSRFCYIHNSLTFRPMSSSDFTLAFPVLPIRTGMNPDPGYQKETVSIGGVIQ